jgi:hypothetical protein
MTKLDQRRTIHTGPPDERNERERWVLCLDEHGAPDRLLQEYETRYALQSGGSHVRPGRIAVPATEFFTAELPHEVRRKLYKAIEELNAPRP